MADAAGAQPMVTVVGIGADGWTGLSPAALHAVRTAHVVAGSARQLALLDGLDGLAAALHPWPTPLLPALEPFFVAHAGRRVAVLASGDPMFFGIGSTLLRLLGADAVQVLPAVSSVSLACARLGWPVEDVEVISAVGRPVGTLHPALQPGRRVLVLAGDTDTAGEVARIAVARGYPGAPFAVLERLAAEDERITRTTASQWTGGHDQLAIVAIECAADEAAAPLPRTPGLPDDAFEHDGQITKREIRAITLAALVPLPGQLLWDVGSGSGSVAVEWMRSHPANRAIAVEPRADRRERIVRNAAALGVPSLQVVDGTAPGVLAALATPDAIFVGGGVSAPGVLDACVAALSGGGRLVANAVTVQAEAAVLAAHVTHGGTLTRIAVQRAEPVGRFTGWRAAMPVTQWALHKERS